MRLRDWWFRRRRREADLEEEIQGHLRMAAQDHMDRGEATEQAHASAVREFGNVTLVKEVTREMWGQIWFETFLQDQRYGLRMMRKNPGFTIVAVLTLAIGIGANTAIFSVVNGVLLRRLPFPEPEQLMTLYEKGQDFARGSVAYPNFLDWRRENHSFMDMAAYREDDFNFTGSGQPEHLSGEYVSASLFRVLRVNPFLGRDFLPREDQQGAGGAVMLSYGLWKRRFGADPDILGKTMTLNAKSFTVIGVLPSDFRLRSLADIYVPLRHYSPVQLDSRENRPGLHVVGRLKSGVTIAAAQAEMDSIGRELARAYPNANGGRGIAVVEMKSDMVAYIRPTLLLLLGAVGFVLIIACTNVANLLLVRSSARSREFAIRAALGAGRKRVIHQLLTESVQLMLAASVFGLLLASWGTRFVLNAVPDTLPRSGDIRIDPYVLLFTLIVSILTGVLFGLVPALHSSNAKTQESLKEGARGSGGGRHRAEGFFVVVEVALAVVLLAGAGLMMQSIWRLWRVAPGFDTHHVLTTQVALSPSVMASPAGIRLAYQQMLARVTTIPSVQSASVTSLIPLSDDNSEIPYWLGGGPQPPQDQTSDAMLDIVTSDYLRTHELGVRMALGASRRNVLRLVVREGMALAAIGMAVGIAAALALTRLMASLLYDVGPADPATFAAVSLLLAGVTLLACYLPAWRATKVDPMVALRHE